jgi:ribosomally synthesized peptide (two-chain TOMM family)
MVNTDFIQQLMEFRTTYLKAVARASVDLAFRQDLTREGGDPLAVLHTAFGYECPWALKVVIHDSPERGPRVNAAGGAVMTLPYWGESITVYLPKKPAGDAREQMDALALYYHENPWFLQNKGESDLLGGTAPESVLTLPPVYEGKWTSVNADLDRNTRFDLGSSFDDFISFAAAMFNAVALAWSNELFLADLTDYKGEREELRKQTITLLNEWLGYKYPWQLDLIVQTDPTATYSDGKWTRTTPPVLMLTLPWMTGAAKGAEAAIQETEANKRNPGVAIMGLALYNTDGPGYPFTCG